MTYFTRNRSESIVANFPPRYKWQWLLRSTALRQYTPVFSLATVTMLISSWVAVDLTKDSIFNNEIVTPDSKCQYSVFDYIVVGGGSAGMVVATRIANASRDIRVLLLEAGGEPHVLNNLPYVVPFLVNQPANTWIYKTAPQNATCGLCHERRGVTTRGKMLGGSSSLNFMLYARGHPRDFDNWAEIANDEQWKYENVLPFFRKSEDYHGAYDTDSSSIKYHGKGGLLNVGTHSYMPGVDDFLAAGLEKGFKIGDYNGENQEVFSKMDVTTANGWRESTYRAFYRDTGRPSNLCIRKYAHVTQILFDTSTPNPKAVGVAYTRHMHKRTAHATKEVILSSGTFGSAKLLMLSGIGPASHLGEVGIPLIKDLPVGHNLQDHAFTIVGPFLKSPSLNPEFVFSAQAASTFFLNGGEGPLAAPSGFSGTAFFRSHLAQPPYPDLQTIQFSFSLHPRTAMIISRIYGFDERKMLEWLYPFTAENADARFPFLILGRPKSFGKITLASLDPNENPIIDMKLLSHPDDMEAMLYGFKKMVDLYENSTSINAPIFPKPVPNCENEVFKSDEYYRCVIRQLSGSFNHAVGGCSIGMVVDNLLRVKGVDGLRVIDASVMPAIPNANTQAATIMIGEKGADLIIQDMNSITINGNSELRNHI